MAHTSWAQEACSSTNGTYPLTHKIISPPQSQYGSNFHISRSIVGVMKISKSSGIHQGNTLINLSEIHRCSPVQEYVQKQIQKNCSTQEINLSLDNWTHLQTLHYGKLSFKYKYFHEYVHFAKYYKFIYMIQDPFEREEQWQEVKKN